MKHIFYHLTAVMVVVVWGMTFISTKVLIVHGLSPQEIFLFRFCWLMLQCVLSLSIVFLPVIWKMSYIWWVAEYWVAPCSSFTEHSSGADTGFKCIFHHMYGPVIDSCSDRIVRSDGKGLKRLHIRIYYCSVGCRLADIQRKFHSSDITFGRFTDSSSFPVMGVLQSCHSESHPEIFSGFHHQKIFFYGIITILPTFLFLPSLTNPAVLLDNEVWSNLLF